MASNISNISLFYAQQRRQQIGALKIQDYDPKVSDEANWLLNNAFVLHGDEWFTVQHWLDKWHNGSKYDWAKDKRDVGLLLAAMELLVKTGHFEGGVDEFGARVFRRRKES